jgi:hypothetical protein
MQHKWAEEKKVVWWWNTRIFGYKFHGFQGFCAYEIQIGTHVFQWFYKNTTQQTTLGKRFRHWIDEYGHRNTMKHPA